MLTDAKNLWTGQSVWADTVIPDLDIQNLTQDLSTDVIIIGAGISGAIMAQALCAAGFKVVILDRRAPLTGSTTATTALLQYELDTPMIELKSKLGAQAASRAWQRSKLALDALEAKIITLNIDCDLQKRNSLYLAGNRLNARQLAKEAGLRRAAGLYCEYLDADALKQNHAIDRKAAILSFNNLTVNPLKLAAGLLNDAQHRGLEIYSPVTVEKVVSRGQMAEVAVRGGLKLKARFVIHATGYELPKGLSKTHHSVHSTYAIATRPQPENLWPDACLIWEASDPYLYIRATPDGRIICGGEDEPFQNEVRRDPQLKDKVRKLQQKLHKLLPDIDPTAEYAWCGSFGSTPTGLPTIGRIHSRRNLFAILAFGGNGITFSSLAAEMLTSQLLGRKDLDAHVFAF